MEYPTFFSCKRTAQDVLEDACAEKNFTINSVIEQVSQHPVIYKHVCTLAHNDGQKFTAAGHGSTRKEAGETAAVKLLTDVLTPMELMGCTSLWNLTMQRDQEIKALLEQSRSGSVVGTISVGPPEYQEILCVDQVSVTNSSACLKPSSSANPRASSNHKACKVEANPGAFSMDTTSSWTLDIDRDNASNEELDKLIPKEFDYLLDYFKDPVQVLEKICEMIEAQVKFTSCKNSHHATICNVILKADGHVRVGDGNSRRHSEEGVGTDREGARNLAARRMLKYLKFMLTFD